MRTLPSTWRPVLLSGLTAMSLLGCSGPQYAGAACHALALGTSSSTLPLRDVGPLPANAWMLADPFIAGTGEVACCARNRYFTPAVPADCAAVDCEALRQRLTRSMLGGAYEYESCGPREGAGACWAYFDGDRVVGVQAFCFD